MSGKVSPYIFDSEGQCHLCIKMDGELRRRELSLPEAISLAAQLCEFVFRETRAMAGTRAGGDDEKPQI
jgi:hypothetical protein